MLYEYLEDAFCVLMSQWRLLGVCEVWYTLFEFTLSDSPPLPPPSWLVFSNK